MVRKAVISPLSLLLALLFAALVAMSAAAVIGPPKLTLHVSGALYHPKTALDPNGTGQWVESIGGADPRLILALFVLTFVVTYVVGVYLIWRWQRQ